MYLFSPASCLSTFPSRHVSTMLLTLLLYHHYNIFRTFLLPYECKERVNISKNINSFPALSVYLYFSVPLGRNFLGSITKFLCKIQFSTCLIDSNAAGRKIACQDIRCMGGRSHPGIYHALCGIISLRQVLTPHQFTVHGIPVSAVRSGMREFGSSFLCSYHSAGLRCSR